MSTTAEEYVLGGLIGTPSLLAEVEPILGDGYIFDDPDYRLIYKAIRSLSEDNLAPDACTITDKLQEQGIPRDQCPISVIVRLAGLMPEPMNTIKYAEIIAETRRARALGLLLDGAREGLIDGSVRCDDVVSDLLTQSVEVLRDDTDSTEALSTSTASVLDALEKQERSDDPGAFAGVDSGFEGFNELTGGWQAGHMNVIAAFPSQGKTAWALASARCVAGGGKRVVFFSMEMPESELNLRLLAMEARVDILRMRNANKSNPLASDEWDRLAKAQKTLAELDDYLIIDDGSYVTVNSINRRIERLNAMPTSPPVRVVFIDYLQLMDVRGENQTHAVSETTKELKRIAKRWTGMGKDLTVLLLSQLTKPRQEDMKNGVMPRPTVRDIRGSGQILADADLVAFIYREAPYLIAAGRSAGEKANTAELIIAKQRNGPLDNIQLGFRGEYTLFHDLAPTSPPF